MESWTYVAVAVLLATAVARWPLQVSLGLYAFLVPFDSIAVLTAATTGPTLNRIVGLATAAVLLIRGFAGKGFVRPPRAAVWWLLFVLWGAVTAAWALDATLVIDRLPTAISLLLMYLVTVSQRVSRKELSSVYMLTILGGIVSSAAALYLYRQGVFYSGTTRGTLMVGERETNPNHLSFALLLPIALSVYGYGVSLEWWRKVSYLVGLVVMVSGFYLTMSRGPFLALWALCALYCLFSARSWKLTIPLCALSAVLLFMPEIFFERLGVLEEYSDERLSIWVVGWEAAQYHWRLGAGLDNFSLAYDQVARGFLGFGKAAHNIYVAAIVESGVGGFAMFVTAIWSGLRRPKDALARSLDDRLQLAPLLEAACLGVLVAGFFQDVIWRKAFWLPWMLLVIVRRLNGEARMPNYRPAQGAFRSFHVVRRQK